MNPRTLSGDGNVIIYVTGPPAISENPVVSVSGNANINNLTSDAKRFQIRSSYNTISSIHVDPSTATCKNSTNTTVTCPINISGQAAWYIWVYAPYTQISAGGNGTNMYGALVGYDFVAPQGNLHFDKALYNAGVAGGGGTIAFQWGAWQACKNPSCT